LNGSSTQKCRSGDRQSRCGHLDCYWHSTEDCYRGRQRIVLIADALMPVDM
jgi:hypothetical protein